MGVTIYKTFTINFVDGELRWEEHISKEAEYEWPTDEKWYIIGSVNIVNVVPGYEKEAKKALKKHVISALENKFFKLADQLENLSNLDV